MSKITDLRKAKNLTQDELSRKLGWTTTTIRNLEMLRTGQDYIERVALLCEALGCQPRDLLENGVHIKTITGESK